MYKITMVKEGLFRFVSNKKNGSNFLITLDSDVADFYRQKVKSSGKDANKYISKILTKGYE